MIRLKTSVLLACAVKMGALQAGAPEADLKFLYRFGERVGLAFQLQDDLLDVYGDPKTFGKKTGGDILEGKKTFLLINALRHAKEEQRAALERWLDTPANTPAEEARKVQEVTKLYNQIGVRKLAEDKIKYYFDTAFISLDAVGVPEERKQMLRNLALSLFDRKS